MKAAAQLISNTIKSKLDFNLSNDERKNISTVGDERLPYVQRSIDEYSTAYPNLNGQAYPANAATLDLVTYKQMQEINTLVKEATERSTEMGLVAGHFCYKFMRDQYDNAEKYRTENVDGAQVVYDGLKDCFADQGPQNPTV